MYTFLPSSTTEGEQRELSVVHELTKKSTHFDADYTTKFILNFDYVHLWNHSTEFLLNLVK